MQADCYKLPVQHDKQLTIGFALMLYNAGCLVHGNDMPCIAIYCEISSISLNIIILKLYSFGKKFSLR